MTCQSKPPTRVVRNYKLAKIIADDYKYDMSELNDTQRKHVLHLALNHMIDFGIGAFTMDDKEKWVIKEIIKYEVTHQVFGRPFNEEGMAKNLQSAAGDWSDYTLRGIAKAMKGLRDKNVLVRTPAIDYVHYRVNYPLLSERTGIELVPEFVKEVEISRYA